MNPVTKVTSTEMITYIWRVLEILYLRMEKGVMYIRSTHGAQRRERDALCTDLGFNSTSITTLPTKDGTYPCDN